MIASDGGMNLNKESGESRLLRQTEALRSKAQVKGNAAGKLGTRKMEPHCAQETKPNSNSTMNVLRMLRPCLRCESYQRVGASNDGGYVMCSEFLRDVRAGYSFGINGADDWGAYISRTFGVPVFEFDCFNAEQPSCKDEGCNLTFRDECLSHSKAYDTNANLYPPGKIARSLQEHLSRNPPPGSPKRDQKAGGDLLLKIDIEGGEWDTLFHARRETLQQMRQIVIEFHVLGLPACHAYFETVLRKVLNAGFLVSHIHGNNWGPMNVLANGRYMVPDDLEVTFVNRHAVPQELLARSACATTEDVLPQDARNDWYGSGLPLAELPGDTSHGLQMHEEVLDPAHVYQCTYMCSLLRSSLQQRIHMLLLQAMLAAAALIGVC